MQGFGLRISHADLLTDALPEAIRHLLGDSQYADAAAKVSTQLRARKRTPAQEAAGRQSAQHGGAPIHTCMHAKTSNALLTLQIGWITRWLRKGRRTWPLLRLI